MVRLSKRKLCSVHNDKPDMCSRIPTSAVHEKIGRVDCIYCGNCCRLSARFFGDNKDRDRVIGEIRKRSDVLKRAGVDGEKVIEWILREDRIPQKGELGIEANYFFEKSHCSLIVLDDHLEGEGDYEYD